MIKDNSKSIDGDILTITKGHKVSQGKTPEVKTRYGGLREVPTLTTDKIGSLYHMRDETNMPLGCQVCQVIDTGMSDANTDNYVTLHMTIWLPFYTYTFPMREHHRSRTM
jgi:hypothetical protein